MELCPLLLSLCLGVDMLPSQAAGPCSVPAVHVPCYGKTDVMFWNRRTFPFNKKRALRWAEWFLQRDMFEGFLRILAVSVLHIKLLSSTLQSPNSPGAALRLILGLVVVDSNLLCHLFFPLLLFSLFFFPFWTKPFSTWAYFQSCRKEYYCVTTPWIMTIYVLQKPAISVICVALGYFFMASWL